MWRGRFAWLFLSLVVLGVLWPVVAGAVSCGDCCAGRTGTCGTATTGFSLCCLHSVSTLPDLLRSGFTPVEGARLALADENGNPPPHPRDILHVPRAFLT